MPQNLPHKRIFFATQHSKNKFFSAFAARKFGSFKKSSYLCIVKQIKDSINGDDTERISQKTYKISGISVAAAVYHNGGSTGCYKARLSRGDTKAGGHGVTPWCPYWCNQADRW